MPARMGLNRRSGQARARSRGGVSCTFVLLECTGISLGSY